MARLAFRHSVRGSCRHHLPPAASALGTQIDDMVRRLDHVHVVFDDDDGVAGVDKAVKAVQQTLDVSQMETGGGLVEDVHNMTTALQLAELGSELDTLSLAPPTASSPTGQE